MPAPTCCSHILAAQPPALPGAPLKVPELRVRVDRMSAGGYLLPPPQLFFHQQLHAIFSLVGLIKGPLLPNPRSLGAVSLGRGVAGSPSENYCVSAEEAKRWQWLWIQLPILLYSQNALYNAVIPIITHATCRHFLPFHYLCFSYAF